MINRIFFLLAFALHWGGLTFYAGVVVRISHDVLNDPMDGGLITQRALAVLQILGVVFLVSAVCNCFTVWRQSRKMGYMLSGCTALLGCSLIGLFVVHGQLDSLIDVTAFEITDRVAFELGHRRYKQLTAVHWLASLACFLIAVSCWRSTSA